MLKLFRIFQGCFTVQLSRFFAVVLISSNFYIISLLLKFVNNFFIYFSIFRLKLCVSCCLCQTASLYYHPFQHLSTAFFIFFYFPPSLCQTRIYNTLKEESIFLPEGVILYFCKVLPGITPAILIHYINTVFIWFQILQWNWQMLIMLQIIRNTKHNLRGIVHIGMFCSPEYDL